MTALRGALVFGAQADIIDLLTAAMGLLDGSLLALVKTPIINGKATTLAEAEAAEADYPGYTTGGTAVASWLSAAKGADGMVHTLGAPNQYVSDDDSDPDAANQIYGGYLTNAGGTVLQAIYTLDNPITLGVDLLQAVEIAPTLDMVGDVVVPYAMQAAVLDSLTPMGEYLAGAKLRLLKAPLPVNQAQTLAVCDANQANYTGYVTGGTAVTTWQAAAKGDDGIVSVDANAIQYLASGTAVSNTIYGAYLVTSDGMTLIAVYSLPAPVTMGVDVLNAVDLQIGVNFMG